MIYVEKNEEINMVRIVTVVNLCRIFFFVFIKKKNRLFGTKNLVKRMARFDLKLLFYLFN